MKYQRLNYTEPAILTGIWVALVGLLAACGLTVSDTVNEQAGLIIGAVSVVVPVVQSLLTRRKVTPALNPTVPEEPETWPLNDDEVGEG